MTTKGNRGFAAQIAAGGGGARLPPRTGVLEGRENRLAALASGAAVTRVQELVDPARCRIWGLHNRDYARLDEAACADLIESFRAQGRQEVPAIVRRVVGEEGVEFEVICGARRHWTVSWLRARGETQFRFLVEPRELSDEEAFRVSDLENRSRKDLSDLERAADYARALERFYDGSQQAMAERMRVSRSWLSRYLELAKLPEWVIGAFGARGAIGISHAAKLAPLLRAPASRRRMEAAAELLVAEQAMRRGRGAAPLGPAEVVTRLTAKPAGKKFAPRVETVRGADGRLVLSGQIASNGGITINIPGLGNREAVLEAVRAVLERLGDR